MHSEGTSRLRLWEALPAAQAAYVRLLVSGSAEDGADCPAQVLLRVLHELDERERDDAESEEGTGILSWA